MHTTAPLNEHELKALIALLDDEDVEVLAEVERRLLSLGEQVIPHLEHAWEEQFNPIVQKRLEELIHSVHFEMVQSRLLLWGSSGAKDLLEGLWIIATYQYPDLQLSDLQHQFDVYIEKARATFVQESTPREQVLALNDLLFNKFRFTANTKNFHSVSNSMINIVLESKKGNPISLCVVYMHIAKALGMPVYGVNLPNLFILTYKTSEGQFYINAFNKGLIFQKSDIDNYLQHLRLSAREVFYQPCTNLDIVLRVLRNLEVSFEKTSQTEKIAEVQKLIAVLEERLR
jgi:regulator of sirC expression with transglutaminase-like and TPR domain